MEHGIQVLFSKTYPEAQVSHTLLFDVLQVEQFVIAVLQELQTPFYNI